MNESQRTKLENMALAAGVQLSLLTEAKRYLRQLAPHVAEREGALLICKLVMQLQDAERMAAVVDEMIYAGHLDSRSQLADARLDYGKPFDAEKAKAILASAPPEALRSGETPRTDAVNASLHQGRYGVDEYAKMCSLARQLERELAATCEMVDDLAQQRDELLASAASPRGK